MRLVPLLPPSVNVAEWPLHCTNCNRAEASTAVQQPPKQLSSDAASRHLHASSTSYIDTPGAAAAVRDDDIITLNVGGRLFSCQRRTLCLVEESLLALMFR